MMKKFFAAVIAAALLACPLCACGSDKSDALPSDSYEYPEEARYSPSITSEDMDGVSPLTVAYEYVDGKDSIEIYYISFGCDINGITLERIDENGEPTETLFSTQSMKSTECFKLITTVPEGFPNSRITVVCGENEYRHQISYNGRDGGANLIEC